MSKSLRVCCLGLIAGLALAGCRIDGSAAKPSSTATLSPTVKGIATLSWQAPTTDTNGAPITNLAGYRIYYGTSATNLSQSVQLNGVGLQTYVIEGLNVGTWFFAIRAVTSAGVESTLSAIVSKTIA